MAFTFTPTNKKKIEEILAKYPENQIRSAIIPILDLAQRQNGGHISTDVITTVATLLKLPEIRVSEVVTFYSMFYTNPVGKYHVQVCGTTPCMLCGAEKTLKTFENAFKIKVGETTKDGLVTLSEVECLGACVNAPVVQINDSYYENVNLDKAKILVEHMKKQTLKPEFQLNKSKQG